MRPPGPGAVLATVTTVERLGAETHLHLRTGEHEFIARAPGRAEVKPKQKLPVTFDLSHAHFFDPATEQSLLAPENPASLS